MDDSTVARLSEDTTDSDDRRARVQEASSKWLPGASKPTCPTRRCRIWGSWSRRRRHAVTVFQMKLLDGACEIAVGADCGEAMAHLRNADCRSASPTAPGDGRAAHREGTSPTTNSTAGRRPPTWAWAAGRKSGGFVGAALAQYSLVETASVCELVPVDGKSAIRAGSQLVASEQAARAGGVVAKQGWVSSATPSAFLGHPIALGFLENGTARHGEEVVAASPISGEFTRVRVVPPVFVDPANERLRS
jgi:hypothetical protein